MLTSSRKVDECSAPNARTPEQKEAALPHVGAYLAKHPEFCDEVEYCFGLKVERLPRVRIMAGGQWGVIENKHSTDVEYLPPPPRVGMSVHLEIVIRYIFVGLLSMTVCLVRGVIESKHSTEVDSPPPPSPQCVCVHIHPDGERQGMLQSWDNSLFSMALLPSRGGSLLRPMTRP